jgi:hypothetical protein
MSWFSGFTFGVMVMLAIDIIYQKSVDKDIMDYMQKLNNLLAIIVKKLEEDKNV